MIRARIDLLRKKVADSFKNKKGFTLIEILVVVALMAIVISSVMSFFVSFVKANKIINANTDLQYEARKLSSFISDKAMESKGIAWISAAGNDVDKLIDSNESVNVGAINFINSDGTFDAFVVSAGNVYYEKNSAYDEFANNTRENQLGSQIKAMYVSPSDGETFKNTKLIKLKISLEKDGETYSFEQDICIRNKE